MSTEILQGLCTAVIIPFSLEAIKKGNMASPYGKDCIFNFPTGALWEGRGATIGDYGELQWPPGLFRAILIFFLIEI